MKISNKLIGMAFAAALSPAVALAAGQTHYVAIHVDQNDPAGDEHGAEQCAERVQLLRLAGR